MTICLVFGMMGAPSAMAGSASDVVDTSRVSFKVEILSSHRAVVTLSGLKIKDSYLTNPSNVAAYTMAYVWGFDVTNADGSRSYDCWTGDWCITPGKQCDPIAVDGMDHLMYINGRMAFRPTHTVRASSISWNIVMPDSETNFSFYDVPSYHVKVQDNARGAQFSRTYTKAQCAQSVQYTLRESDRETFTYLAMAKLATNDFATLHRYAGRDALDMVNAG